MVSLSVILGVTERDTTVKRRARVTAPTARTAITSTATVRRTRRVVTLAGVQAAVSLPISRESGLLSKSANTSLASWGRAAGEGSRQRKMAASQRESKPLVHVLG